MTMRATRSRRIAPTCAFALVALLLASTAAHAECVAPSYLKLKPPVYPPAAIKAKAEGKVIVGATIALDGVPGDLAVVTSGGNADLDQAALDAVATWRFNPASCDGVPALQRIAVPVDFSLVHETTPDQTLGVMADGDAPAPGTAIPTDDHRELAPDRQPIAAATVAALLAKLRDDERGAPAKVIRIDPQTTLSMYFGANERGVYEVVQSSERGWSAVSAGWTSIIRTRFANGPNGVTRELYSQLCDGDAEWCKTQLVVYLARMRESPPPIPPPRAPDPDAP
jgi:TonB family protein